LIATALGHGDTF